MLCCILSEHHRSKYYESSSLFSLEVQLSRAMQYNRDFGVWYIHGAWHLAVSWLLQVRCILCITWYSGTRSRSPEISDTMKLVYTVVTYTASFSTRKMLRIWFKNMTLIFIGGQKNVQKNVPGNLFCTHNSLDDTQSHSVLHTQYIRIPVWPEITDP